MDFYIIDLWICFPWDFCASSWDHEIVLKTVRLERSALGWGEGCPMLWQIYAWRCIGMKILYESTRIKNKKYNENLNNAMHKYGWVLDKYGGGGGGGMYVPSLNFKFGHFLFWGVFWGVHVPLPGWYLPMFQLISCTLMLLFRGHVAKKCVIIACTRPNRLLTQLPACRRLLFPLCHKGNRRRLHASNWLRGYEGERNNCCSKIQLVGWKYQGKTT